MTSKVVCDGAFLDQDSALHAGATTYRTVLDVDRGLSWAEAVAMRDAHVAEVLAAGSAVDPRVGFHLFTTQKEVGRTGAAAAHSRTTHSQPLGATDTAQKGLHMYWASTLPAVTYLHGRNKSEQLLLGARFAALCPSLDAAPGWPPQTYFPAMHGFRRASDALRSWMQMCLHPAHGSGCRQ